MRVFFVFVSADFARPSFLNGVLVILFRSRRGFRSCQSLSFVACSVWLVAALDMFLAPGTAFTKLRHLFVK